MANVDRGKGQQGEHPTNDLNFGHLGTATYESDGREWKFLRRCVYGRLSQSAFPFVVVKRETAYGSSPNKIELPLTYDLSSLSASIYGIHVRSAVPGLASANFQEEELLSSAITTSLGQYNPLFADRLAFGSASYLLDHDVRSGNVTVPIVALASGANGESITLTQIGTERVEFSDQNEQDFVLRIPTITSNNRTAWTGNGEIVLQICFAATSGYQSTWMAARLPSSTIVFHPLFHKRPVPAMTQTTNGSRSDIRSSNLDANPILHIPVSRTGGYPHADISFHPFDCHRLALIDQHGNWSTWQMGGKRSVTNRVLYSIQLLRTGKFYTWENLRRPPQADPYHDSWHKICWVADGSGYFGRVFLANRRSAVICDPAEEEKYPLSLGLGPLNEAQWILDIKTSALRPAWIFILTSTRVLCVSTTKEEGRDMPLTDSHEILCSWNHFRGRRDFTLSLTMLEMAQCTFILLASRINPIVNAYRIDVALKHPHVSLSWFEPQLLDLSNIVMQSSLHETLESPLTLLMRPVQIQRPSATSCDPVPFSLTKLFILRADRSVSEVLMEGLMKPSAVEDQHSANTLQLPPGSYVGGMSSKYAELDEFDDFIVHEPQDLAHAYPGLDKGGNEQRHTTGETILSITDSEIEMQEICESTNPGSTNEQSRKRAQLDNYLQGIRPKLGSTENIQPGVKLLSDLDGPLLVVADVESSSTTISSMVESSSLDGQASSVAYPLLGKLGSTTALDLYQILVSDWLRGLPPGVPDRIRVNKERLARNVAADLALAAIATRPSLHELGMPAIPETAYPDSTPPPAVISAPTPDSNVAEATVHPQPVSPHPPAPEEHPAYVRLHNYTTISSNVVTTATPASVLDILAHIPQDTGIDPSAYDWRVTEAAIIAERDKRAEAADPRARRRAEKLAHAKRRRIQSQMEAAGELARQRAPPAIGSSQIVLPTREVKSSQPVPPGTTESGDYGPMTQPERGPFGRRLGGIASGRKDKGKKREAGFW